ncbi:MAG: hypothetical protein H0U49_05325, partial [Parachlamydiaceae bacterium]|nr:hypothetical protein [Parachlamydiaceae bacterium]
KIDSDDAPVFLDDFSTECTVDADKLYKISAKNGDGIPALLRAIHHLT